MNTESANGLYSHLQKAYGFDMPEEQFLTIMQDDNEREGFRQFLRDNYDFDADSQTFDKLLGITSTPQERVQQARSTAQAASAQAMRRLQMPQVERPKESFVSNLSDEGLDAALARYGDGRKTDDRYEQLQQEKAWRQYNNQNSEYAQLGNEIVKAQSELAQLRKTYGRNIDTGGIEAYLEKAAKEYQAPSRYGSESGLSNWWQGLIDKMSEGDTWLLDIPEMFRTANMVNVVKKLNRDEELDEREQALVNAFFLYGQVQDARQGDMSRGYKIGTGTAESIPFMAEMFITAGIGAAGKKALIKSIVKSGNKTLAKRVARAFGDDIVEAGGKIAIRETEKKFGERVARGAAEDALMTAFMPTTYAKSFEDELDKILNGEEYTFRDLMRSYTDAVIETGTERWGGKIIDKTLGKAFKPLNKIWGKTSWGSFLTNDFIQSPLGETGEEYIGAVVNYIRSFNPMYSDKSNEELRAEARQLFSADGFVDTMLTVLPMSVVGGGVNVGFKAKEEIAKKNSIRYKEAKTGFKELLVDQGATPEQADIILMQLEDSKDSNAFVSTLGNAFGMVKQEYIRNHPDLTNEQLKEFEKKIDKVFGEYVKAAKKVNDSAGELKDMYDKLSAEEKKEVSAKIEEIAKPIAEAIPEGQKGAPKPLSPAEPTSAPSEEQKSVKGKNGRQEVKVSVDGQEYTVTGKVIEYNEDGSIKFDGGKNLISIIGPDGKPIYGKANIQAAQQAINDALLAKKQEEEGGKLPERDVNAEIVVDQSLPLQEQLAQLQQQYQAAAEKNDAELMQALDQRIAAINQAIEDSLTDEERAARAAAAAEAEAAARAAEEEKRIQGIFDQISQALTEKGRKVLSGLTPEQKFIWRWRKPGGSIEDAIERAKAGIEESKSIRDAEERDYEIEQWQALIDKYAPQEEKILPENSEEGGNDLDKSGNNTNFVKNSNNNGTGKSSTTAAGNGAGATQVPVGTNAGGANNAGVAGGIQGGNGNGGGANGMGKRGGQGEGNSSDNVGNGRNNSGTNPEGDGSFLHSGNLEHVISVEKERNDEITGLLNRMGLPHVPNRVVQVDGELFRQQLIQEKPKNKNGWMVGVHPLESADGEVGYNDCKCYLIDNGKAGVAVTPDGDIISFFSSIPNGNVAEKLMAWAIANGGRKCDCYANGLQGLYTMFGGKPISQTPFNEEFAPEDWDGKRRGPVVTFIFPETAEEALQTCASYKQQDMSIKQIAATVDLSPSVVKEFLDNPEKNEWGYDLAMEYRDKVLSGEIEPGTKYANDELLADDVVVIVSDKYYSLARKIDGKYIDVKTGKPKTGNYSEVEKKVVYLGDKKYILQTKTSWDLLKDGYGSPRNNTSQLKAWDITTGEDVYLNKADLEREAEVEVGEGKKKVKKIARVPVWKNPADRQKLKDLKRTAKTLDDILDYVVLTYQSTDGVNHDVTLRDFLREASTVGENGRTVRIDTIDRFLNDILVARGYEPKTRQTGANLQLGEDEESLRSMGDNPSIGAYNTMVGDIRAAIDIAIRAWNEMKGTAKEDKVTIKNGEKLNQSTSSIIKFINKKQDETGEDYLVKGRRQILQKREELDKLEEQIKAAKKRGDNEMEAFLQDKYDELAKVEDNTDIEEEKKRARKEEEEEKDSNRLALLKTRNGIMLDLLYARKRGDEAQTNQLQQQVNDLNKRISEYDNGAIELQAGEETQGSAIRRQAGERMVKIVKDAGVPVEEISDADLPNYIGNEAYEELRTKGGVVYGFAKEGKIYVVKERMNPDTPLHEYTHIWVSMMRKKDPKMWGRIKGLLKRTNEWQNVLSDDKYKKIHNNEEAVASEVMARLCGIKWGEIVDDSGKTRYDEMLEQASTVEEKSVLMSVRKAIEDFFRTILEWWNINIGKTKGFNDLVDRALQMPVQDLMKWSDAIQDMTSKESRKLFDEMMATYHGTTADFDKFDFTFMGSGEGMQAFGWGGYVSRVKDVAIGYANRGDSKAVIDGKTIESRRLSDYLALDYHESNILNNILSYGITDIESYLRKEIKRMEDELNDIRNMTQEEYNEKYSGKGYHSYRDVIDNLPKTIDYYKNTLDEVEYSGVKIVRNPRLYTIEIPDDNGSNYLAWNERPTKEQFDRINDALEKIGQGRLKGYDSIEGEYTYKVLASILGFHDDKRASAFLRQCGFVGIKVPIGYAHGKKYEGEDQMNYVIFNEDDMKIVDKTTDFDMRAAEGKTLSAEEQRIKSEAQERGDFMKAPDSTDTKLTEKQWCQVRTEAFKKWAGDWENGEAHIFLDENGEPKVLYHGTRHFGFRSFDIQNSRSAPGVFFADNENNAKGYAGLMADISHLGETKKEATAKDVLDIIFGKDIPLKDSMHLITTVADVNFEQDGNTLLITPRSTGNAFGIDLDNTSKEEARKLVEDNLDTDIIRSRVLDSRRDSGIYAAFVRADNVFEVDADGAYWDEIPTASIDGYPQGETGYTNTNDIARWAKEQGYDGVIIRNTYDSAGEDYGFFSGKTFDEYISLRDKGNIKSATDNRGTFDENNPDIEFSIGSPDPSDISTKVAERMEKKAERVLKNAPSMGTKPAQRLDGWARIIYENQDNTWGLHLLQEKINLWRKEHGKDPIPDSQDARSLLVRLEPAQNNQQKDFENHQGKHLREVMDALAEKIGKSELMEQFKEDNFVEVDDSGNKFHYQPTAEDLLERYLIARDNIERAEMQEAGSSIAPRGEWEFAQRMGISMSEYVELVHKVLSEEEINNLWDAVRACTRFALDKSYECGLKDKDYVDDMKERQFYVPEKGFAEERTNEDLAAQREADRNKRRGGKKSVSPNAFAHKAKGGDSMATDIFAHIIADVDDVIAKGLANNVRRAMYDLMNDNMDYTETYDVPRPAKEWFIRDGEHADGSPNYVRSFEVPSDEDLEEAKFINGLLKDMRTDVKELREKMKNSKRNSAEWKEAKARLDDALEYMKELRNSLPFITSSKAAGLVPTTNKKPGTPEVEVYVNGDKYMMTFAGMKEVADALNGEFDKTAQSEVVKKLNAVVASLFTTYNPTFFAVNIARDTPYIVLKGMSEYGPEFIGRFAKAMTVGGGADMRKAIYQYLAGDLDTTSKVGKQLHDFLMGGGNTGYTQLKDIKAIREQFNKSKYEAIKFVPELFAKMNEYSELLTRFAAYRTVLDMGYSENEALNAAKNLSTNFNMRGAGNWFINHFNNMSMFANAAIQGAAGFYKTFNTPEKAKRAFLFMVLSPAFAGFLNTLIYPDDDDKEREVADYYRDNYFCFGPIKIPITQELRPFWRIGVNIGMGVHGRRTAGEIAQSLISGFTEYSIPVPPTISQSATGFVNGIAENGLAGGVGQGITNFAVNSFIPQYADGIKELLSNKDFMGNPIFKKYDWSDMPMYTYNQSEAEMYKDWARALYILGGGNPDHPSKYNKNGEEIGFFDVSPKMMKKVAGIGLSTGTLQLLCTLHGIRTGVVEDIKNRELGNVRDNIRSRDIPLVGTFYRPEEQSMYRYKIYKEMNDKVKAYDLQLKGWNDHIKNVSSEAKKAELTRQRDEWMAREQEKGFDITEAKRAIKAYKESSAYNVAIKLGRKEEDVKAEHPDWEDKQKQSVQVMNEMLMVYKGLKEQVDAIQPQPQQRGGNRPQRPQRKQRPTRPTR